MFDAKYNIIPITEAYELDQSLLASEPFTSIPRGASTLVGLMLIFQYILGLQSQSIDFTNSFAQADIPSGETILIELPREFQE